MQVLSLPRGRIRQDPIQAKADSIIRIESALQANPRGLRFQELKRHTRLHQDTLAIRLPELTDTGQVRKEGRYYLLSENGFEDLDKLRLLEAIAACSGFSMSGPGMSLTPSEDVILRSSLGFAFPGIPPDSLRAIMTIVHKYWMLQLIRFMINNRMIEACRLTPDSIDLDTVKIVSEALKHHMPKEQILAFRINRDELAARINVEYLRELLRIAGVEAANQIEGEATRLL
jgi:hypothetical protein